MDTFELESNNLPERRLLWSDKETKFFLKILEEYHVTQHLEQRKYRNAGVFQALEEPMRAAGFNRTFSQLRIKWKNMKKSFVDGRRLVSSGSLPYTVCPFYDELYLLLRNHPTICHNNSSDGDIPTNYDNMDMTSNGSEDCRDDIMGNQGGSAVELFNQFAAESSSREAIKKEPEDTKNQICVDPSKLTTLQKLSCIEKMDPDELFLAMILPDIRKLSISKKRKVKMDIQKLLDEALTEEEQ